MSDKPIFYCFGKVNLPEALKAKIVEKMKPFYCLSDPEIGEHEEYGLVLYCSRKTESQERLESGQHMIEGLVDGYRLALGPVKKYCVAFFKWSNAAWEAEQKHQKAWDDLYRWERGDQEYVPTKKVKMTIEYFGSVEEADAFIQAALEDKRNTYIWESHLDHDKYAVEFVHEFAGTVLRSPYRQLYKSDAFGRQIQNIFEDYRVKNHFAR